MQQVTLNLPKQLLDRAQRYAHSTKQSIDTVFMQVINKLPEVDDWDDEAVEREKAAYIKLHPTLKQTHFGRYVAIYQGQLIDEDDAFEPLFDRIEEAYPNDYVWLTPVREEAIETFKFRSPRLVH